jgi:hypothetical protein
LRLLLVFVPRTSSTLVATWFWQTEGRSAEHVILGVQPSEFILLQFRSPSRTICIGSYSLPLSGRLIGPLDNHCDGHSCHHDDRGCGRHHYSDNDRDHSWSPNQRGPRAFGRSIHDAKFSSLFCTIDAKSAPCVKHTASRTS